MVIRSHTSSTTSAWSSGSSPQQPSPSTGAEDRAGIQMAEIQKYNRQTNQLSIHYFTKKVMDLGVQFLPNSVKKYLTTPPTKGEISHVQHHQRTTPYTWICQPVLWFTTSEFHFKCTNGPEQLLIRIMAHYIRKCASIFTLSSLSWQTLENGTIKITLPVFSSLMSHNL